jgi:hypothetical protein
MLFKPRQKINRELPPVGTKMTGRGRLKSYHAVIVKDPQAKSGKSVKLDGKLYSSLTAAAKSLTGYSINGWRFWKL